nr:MAG TPA: hypothetical protein [Caudoviricetes sp.]
MTRSLKQMLLRDKLLSGVKKYVYGGQYGKDAR